MRHTRAIPVGGWRASSGGVFTVNKQKLTISAASVGMEVASVWRVPVHVSLWCGFPASTRPHGQSAKAKYLLFVVTPLCCFINSLARCDKEYRCSYQPRSAAQTSSQSENRIEIESSPWFRSSVSAAQRVRSSEGRMFRVFTRVYTASAKRRQSITPFYKFE